MSKLAKEEFLLKAGYSAKAIKLYMNQVNVGSIDKPDIALAYTGGPPCGDTIKIYLKLSKNNVIQDAKFQYIGCAGTACSGSALTTLVIGKTVEEAQKITEEDILKELGGLPESHCAKLAVTTLHKALEKIGKLEEKSTASL